MESPRELERQRVAWRLGGLTLLVVVVVQFINVVHPELLHGQRLTPGHSRLFGLSHDPTDGAEGDYSGGTIDVAERSSAGNQNASRSGEADEDEDDPNAALEGNGEEESQEDKE